jgi:hypothetical protein
MKKRPQFRFPSISDCSCFHFFHHKSRHSRYQPSFNSRYIPSVDKGLMFLPDIIVDLLIFIPFCFSATVQVTGTGSKSNTPALKLTLFFPDSSALTIRNFLLSIPRSFGLEYQSFRERFANPSDLSVFVFGPAHCISFTLSSFVYIFTRFLTTLLTFARLLSDPIADSPGSRTFLPVRSRLAQPRVPLGINLARQTFDTVSCR